MVFTTGAKVKKQLENGRQKYSKLLKVEQMKKIALGAGCFWGVEAAFKLLPGISKTRVGYMGGHVESPTYEQVCQKTTGHAEVVLLEYDEKELSLEKVLDLFFFIHNPYQVGGQGNDIDSSV